MNLVVGNNSQKFVSSNYLYALEFPKFCRAFILVHFDCLIFRLVEGRYLYASFLSVPAPSLQQVPIVWDVCEKACCMMSQYNTPKHFAIMGTSTFDYYAK